MSLTLVNNLTSATAATCTCTFFDAGASVAKSFPLKPASALAIPFDKPCTLAFAVAAVAGVTGTIVKSVTFTPTATSTGCAVISYASPAGSVFGVLVFNGPNGLANIYGNTTDAAAYFNFGMPGVYDDAPLKPFVPTVPFTMTSTKPGKTNGALTGMFKWNVATGYAELFLWYGSWCKTDFNPHFCIPLSSLTCVYATCTRDASIGVVCTDAAIDAANAAAPSWNGMLKCAKSQNVAIVGTSPTINPNTMYYILYESFDCSKMSSPGTGFLYMATGIYASTAAVDVITYPGLLNDGAAVVPWKLTQIPKGRNTVDSSPCIEKTIFGCPAGTAPCAITDTDAGSTYCAQTLSTALRAATPSPVWSVSVYNGLATGPVTLHLVATNAVEITVDSMRERQPCVSYGYSGTLTVTATITLTNTQSHNIPAPSCQFTVALDATLVPGAYPWYVNDSTCIQYASATVAADATTRSVYIYILPQTFGSAHMPLYGYLPDAQNALPATWGASASPVSPGTVFTMAGVTLSVASTASNSSSSYLLSGGPLSKFVFLTSPITGLLLLCLFAADGSTVYPLSSLKFESFMGKTSGSVQVGAAVAPTLQALAPAFNTAYTTGTRFGAMAMYNDASGKVSILAGDNAHPLVYVNFGNVKNAVVASPSPNLYGYMGVSETSSGAIVGYVLTATGTTVSDTYTRGTTPTVVVPDSGPDSGPTTGGPASGPTSVPASGGPTSLKKPSKASLSDGAIAGIVIGVVVFVAVIAAVVLWRKNMGR